MGRGKPWDSVLEQAGCNVVNVVAGKEAMGSRGNTCVLGEEKLMHAKCARCLELFGVVRLLQSSSVPCQHLQFVMIPDLYLTYNCFHSLGESSYSKRRGT
jgi:hypothetical protein